MLASLYSRVLSSYYERTYGVQFPMRVGSSVLLTALFHALGILDLPQALLWQVVYVAGELAMRAWWAHTEPKLEAASEREVLGYHNQMIAISAGVSNWAPLPCLIAATQGGQNAVLGLVFSAGCLLILAAQHSLSSRMFLMTAPVATVGLVANVHALASPTWQGWLLTLFTGSYILNAFTLHRSNTSSVTEMVRVQLAAEAANRTKRTFLATMSHEIRTPLNGVLGMAQAMELNELSPDQRERLNVVRSSGETLLALLNDLLDYSKIEAGKIELEQVEFSLAGCITDACQGPAMLAAEKGLSFTVDVNCPPGLYRGDPVRVRQIVQNLVSNAIKFTRRGRVTVEARFDGEAVAIAVTDTGIGISEVQKARLFSEFVQADGSTTRQFGGTGLGLAICRDLAQLMGGDILVDSEVGMGSTFTAHLPLTHIGGADTTAAARTAGIEGASADDADVDVTLRVLVAEDNPANRLVLQQLLAHTNTEADFVANGELAVEAARLTDWDLILMDVQMPVMDGLTATREIRDAERRTARPRTPIYALTADAMSHQVESCRAAGMDGHLSKPIVIAELFALIDELSVRRAAAIQSLPQAPIAAAS